MAIGLPELLVLPFIFAMLLVVMWPAGRICRRLGYSPWLGILAAFPLLNLCLLWFVALSKWPRDEAAG